MFQSLASFNTLGGIGSIIGIVALIISGFFYIQIQKIKSRPDNTTASTEQFQTIFQGYMSVIETLQDELERLKLKLIMLEEEQTACEKRNEELTLEVQELYRRLEMLGA